MSQSNTRVGDFRVLAGEDLTGKESYLVKLTHDSGVAEVLLPAANSDYALFLVLEAAVDAAQGAWRQVVAAAVRAGLPVPALGAGLAYYDGYRSKRLPHNLLQAQRDYFGAHTYERIDRQGRFHTDWQKELKS